MGKITAKKENKRKSLLNSAFELFTTKDFQSTSIADIAEKAGIAKGTFYLYFHDKDDIRKQLIAAKSTMLFRNACVKLSNTNITALDDQFIFLTDELLDYLKEDKAMLAFLSKHLSWGIFKNSLSDENAAEGVTVREMYDQLITNSGYRFENTEIIIYLIVELVAGVSYNAILYEDPAPLEELKPYIHTMIRKILQEFNQA